MIFSPAWQTKQTNFGDSYIMTMISYTVNKGVPVITGDILLSSPDKQKEFSIPAFSEDILQYLSPDQDFHPIAIKQKLYIVAPNICIAFSGNVYYFKKFLEDIFLFCKIHKTVTIDKLEPFLQEYKDNEAIQEYSVLILMIEKIGFEIQVSTATHGQWLKRNTPVFGEIMASGSGANSYIEEAMIEASTFSKLQYSPSEYAIQMNAIMICRLLTRERANLHTLMQHWGAGFELVYFNDGRFSKLDDITYVINQAHFNEHGEIEVPVPVIVLHYKYYGEVLVITAIKPSRGTTQTTEDTYIIQSKDLVVRSFVVTPIYYPEDYNPENLIKDNAFTSRMNALGYILKGKNESWIPASFNIGSELIIQYNPDTGLSIIMLKDINDTLIREARKNYLLSKEIQY
jgi:hypothetical protein